MVKHVLPSKSPCTTTILSTENAMQNVVYVLIHLPYIHQFVKIKIVACIYPWSIIYHTWRFPEIGVPLLIIYFNRDFPYKPSIFRGYHHDYGTPHDYTVVSWFIKPMYYSYILHKPWYLWKPHIYPTSVPSQWPSPAELGWARCGILRHRFFLLGPHQFWKNRSGQPQSKTCICGYNGYNICIYDCICIHLAIMAGI